MHLCFHSVWSYDLVLHKVACLFLPLFLSQLQSKWKVLSMYSSCFFLLVLVQARQRGPQQRLQRMPGLHPPTTPPRQGKGGNQSWQLTCQIPQGILFLTSLFSSKSWQGLVLFEILCPQWFLYSSRLPRPGMSLRGRWLHLLHCICSFMAIQIQDSRGLFASACSHAYAWSWIWRWSSSHLWGMQWFWPCALFFHLSLVPSAILPLSV